MHIALIVLLLALGIAGCGPTDNRSHDAIVIENVTVIDPVRGASAGQRVVIADGHIQTVAPMTDPHPRAAEPVDGHGRYLIPGLWDMHVHFLYDAALTDLMPGLFLDYGITSVRDTGGNLERMVALTGRLEASEVPAPTIYFAGPLLDGPFVVYDGATAAQPALGTGIPDPSAAAAYVERLRAAGADLIKIYELVSPEVFETLAGAARQQGLPIAAHVPLTMTADTAGPQVDSMEHLRNLELACAANWQELLAARRARIGAFTEGRGFELRRELHRLQRLPAIAAYDEARCDAVLKSLSGTLQVPTLRLNTVATVLPFDHPDWSSALRRLPESTRQAWLAGAARMRNAAPVANHSFAEWSLFLISRLIKHRVPIAAGTDTPIGLGVPGWSLHTELELLVRGGLSPLQALHAASVASASFFGIENEVGRIEPGMRADLVLLDADPLADIGNTRRISRVMKAGLWVR